MAANFSKCYPHVHSEELLNYVEMFKTVHGISYEANVDRIDKMIDDLGRCGAGNIGSIATDANMIIDSLQQLIHLTKYIESNALNYRRLMG